MYGDTVVSSFRQAADHEEEALDELGRVGFWGGFIGKRSAMIKQAKESCITLNLIFTKV